MRDPGFTTNDLLALPFKWLVVIGLALVGLLGYMLGFLTASFLIRGSGAAVLFYFGITHWSTPPAPCSTAPNPKRRGLITDRFSMDKVPKDVDYVIVGSGMSGLSSASMLSRAGYKVLVLEQHDRCGGGTHTYELGKAGYQFDAGLHYTVPWSGPLIDFATDNKTAPVIFDNMGITTKGDPREGAFDSIVLGSEARDPTHPSWLDLKHKEAHLPALYDQFPDAHDDIDRFLSASNVLLMLTPLVILSKLFPVWIQHCMWKTVLAPFAKYAGQPALKVMRQLVKNKKLASFFSGLWIDTGCRPDTGTFFLMASVIRGLPREGGAYPRGGSQVMAEALVESIERNGGRVLVLADVGEILIDPTTGAATGVQLKDKDQSIIAAKQGVISSAGYTVTFKHLLPEAVAKEHSIPIPLSIAPSAGFVMVNVGFKGDSKTFNIENTNVWHHPATAEGDIFEPLERFFNDPFSLTDEEGLPIMITFPSIKDQTYEAKHPGKLTCQMLVMAKWDWFAKWKDDKAGDRSPEYQALKLQWKDKCLAMLHRFYPQLKGKEDFVDVSTPLSINHYLRQPHGSAVGLEPSPLRYDGKGGMLKHLDVVTPIPKLYMTGQDTLVCGVVLAQATGIITAFRVMGVLNMLKIIVRTMIHGG